MTIDTIPHSWSPLLLICFICITSSFLLSHQTIRVTHPLDRPKKEDRFNQAIRSSKVVIDCTSHNRWPYHRFRADPEGSSTPKIQTEDPRRTARSRTKGAQRGRQHRPRPRLQRSRQLRTNKNTQQSQKGSLQQISEVWKNRRTTDRTCSRNPKKIPTSKTQSTTAPKPRGKTTTPKLQKEGRGPSRLPASKKQRLPAPQPRGTPAPKAKSK